MILQILSPGESNGVFNYATYHQIQTVVNNSDFASTTFIGIQIFASTFIIIKLIWNWIKDVSSGNRMNNVLESVGVIVFISLAPYALDAIESAFAIVDTKLSNFQSYAMPPAIKSALIEVEKSQDSSWVTAINNVFSLIYIALLAIVAFILYAVDTAIYATFVLERMVMIEFYRWVFPLFIAFIGIDGLRNRYWHWVTGFLGLMILPIPYIAIYNICQGIQTLLFDLNRSPADSPSLIYDVFITIIILIMTIGMKFKLLTTVTQKVAKLF